MTRRMDPYATWRWNRLEGLAERLVGNFTPDQLADLAEDVNSIAAQSRHTDEWAVLRAAFALAMQADMDRRAATQAMRRLDAEEVAS